MCNTINGICYLFVIIQLITFFSTFSVVQSLVFTETTLSMPVKTQSMTKGGLQNTIDPVPPPSTCLTCPNAITSTPKSTVLTDSTDLLLELPELSKRSTLSLSSSEFDSSTNSSLDKDEFENFEFQNFKLSSGTLLSTHNFQLRAQFVTMESDCQDTKLLGDQKESSSTNDEILNMLTAISSRMVAGHQDLQNQLIRNNLKLETNCNGSVKKMLNYVRIYAKNLDLFYLMVLLRILLKFFPMLLCLHLQFLLQVLHNQLLVHLKIFKLKMLSVLNDTFSKLSSVISDTSTILQDTKQALNDSKLSDSKMDWIKFAGDHKKFRSWFLAIMAQLSIAPWSELYDPDTNSVVSSTNNDTLNGKLYAKVIGSLDGPALQHMISRPHLRGNGILLLRELHQMYKPKNVPEVIVAKTAEFWGTTKYHSHETVDDYYNRFQELLEDLSDADESISKKSAIQHFIFTLGPEFEPLQHNYHLGSILRNEKPRIGPLSWYFVGTSITLSIR